MAETIFAGPTAFFVFMSFGPTTRRAIYSETTVPPNYPPCDLKDLWPPPQITIAMPVRSNPIKFNVRILEINRVVLK